MHPRLARYGNALRQRLSSPGDGGLRALTGLLILTVAGGTIFYAFVEGWSALDALYFSVITLATVGYGDLAPKTAPGKVFTILYVITGIGILATFASTLAQRLVDRRLRHARFATPLRAGRMRRRPVRTRKRRVVSRAEDST